MNKKFPRVLIIGQPFNTTSGGGITISSLFNNWPRVDIALATIPNKVKKNNFEICQTVYCLGKDELKINFPFSLFFRNSESGLVKFKSCLLNNKKETGKINPFYSALYRFCYNLVFLFDLNYLFFRIHPSEKFIKFINEYKPDVIYTQLGHLEFNLFINQLYDYIETPLALHIMDDWPNYSAHSIFKKYWQNKLNISFRSLVDKASFLLSISEAMSEDYFFRYGRVFKPFHNPVECNQVDYLYRPIKGKNYIVVVYAGRIGTANAKGISDICKAVNLMKMNGVNISIELYSPDSEKMLEKSIKNLNGVIVKKPVEHSKIFGILQSADLLFLPLDFNEKSIGFAKLSMPTKATEYMLSGTPILLYAPKEMGVAKSANKYGWAKSITNRSIKDLYNAILDFIKNEDEHQEFSKKAFDYVVHNYNADNIREKFRLTLTDDTK